MSASTQTISGQLHVAKLADKLEQALLMYPKTRQMQLIDEVERQKTGRRVAEHELAMLRDHFSKNSQIADQVESINK